MNEYALVIGGYDDTMGFGPGLFDDYPAGGFANPSSGTGINWGSVINRGFDLASQAFSAWGRNPSQQIGTNATVGIGQGYSPASTLAAQAQAQQAAYQQQLLMQQQLRGGVGGGGIDQSVSSALAWAQQNWFIIVGGLVAWKLFTADPAKSRR